MTPAEQVEARIAEALHDEFCHISYKHPMGHERHRWQRHARSLVASGVLAGMVADALRDAAAVIRKQAPGEPGCAEDAAYYDGHMAASRVVDEIAAALDPTRGEK